MEIGPLVPEKMAHGGHLGHMTSIMLKNVHFLVSESLHIKFGKKMAQWFLRKASLNFHM